MRAARPWIRFHNLHCRVFLNCRRSYSPTSLDADFSTAEWGFALGSPFWGRGLFSEGARLVMDFAFEEIGVNRLEARAMAENDRANGALRKVGAYKEAVLRQSMVKNGYLHDEHLWAIVETDWRQASSLRHLIVH